jgi:hypothetical protein
MESSELKDICITAIDAACVSRGRRKGMLKASCPNSRTDGAAAWQAMVGHANPYKMSIYQIMFFSDRQRAIYDAIDKSLEGTDVRSLDRDRIVLEKLGAW